MGFGFNLKVFPILIFLTIGLIVNFLRSKNKYPLFLLTGLWGFTIFIFVVVSTFNHYQRPIKLTKENIIGEYRIDTNL